MEIALQQLKTNLIAQFGGPSGEEEKLFVRGNGCNNDVTLRKIEEVILRLVADISVGDPPNFTYNSTANWSDVSFGTDRGFEIRRNQRMTTVRFEAYQSVKKFGLMVKILSLMYRLVKTKKYCTKRDMYYQNPSLFGNQHTLDGIVDNISCMLQIPRWELHVLATSKGCIAGDLQFQDADNNYIDCRHTQMGVLVPNHIQGIHNIATQANFILVVEKDATFQKLLETDVCKKFHPCIIITGKGFPDMNTRMLLRKLWNMFAIPILALVDADPHGIEIMAVYKFGSRSLSYETDYLAVPSMKWLGLFPTDIERLGIPESALIPLRNSDREKAEELLSRPYMKHHPAWQKEVEQILLSNNKAEIQALDSISQTFLTDVYLPSKIHSSGWL